MKKRIILLLLALVGCVWMKAETFTIDGLSYDTYAGNTVKVTKCSKERKGDFVIPSTVLYNDVEYTVTSIGYSAFYGCSGLTSVVIPEGVTSIGSHAFFDCSGLTSVVIPARVTSIGDFVFQNCSGLTSVVIPEGVTSIGDQAFQYCSALTSVVIPEGVTSIGTAAFYGCRGLTSVVIPESVTRIGDFAFKGCSGLTSVVVDANNKTYDSRNNCNAIIKTATNTLVFGFNCSTIPGGVTSIGSSAFYGCSGLTSVVIPESVTSIGDQAFECCSSLTSVVIPARVTSMGSYAFDGCSGLTSVVISKGVTSIGLAAFQCCYSLESVVIPASVTSIGGFAFNHCYRLKSVAIPEGVTTIDDNTFCGCNSLTSMVIPEGVTSIGEKAFKGCKGLTSVFIRGSAVSIGEDAFKDIPNCVVYCLPYFTLAERKTSFGDCNVVCASPFVEIVGPSTASLSCVDMWTFPYDGGRPTAVDLTMDGVTMPVPYSIQKQYVRSLRPETQYSIEVKLTFSDGSVCIFKNAGLQFTTSALEFTTLTPSVVSSGCAIVAANTNISDKETSVGFQWRKTTAPDDVPSKEAYTAIYDGRLEGYIKNLQTDVYYRTRPFYKAADGTYYYGEWIGFDPSDFTYFEPTVHTYPVENLTDEEASVRGYVLPGTDEVKTQGFEYWPTNGISPAPRRVYAKAPATDVSVVFAKGQVMTATLTGLRPQTDYTYRAFVETTTGQTTYGEEQTFTTPVPTGTPTGIVTLDADEPEPEAAGYYDLSGRRIAEPLQHGITIIRYADGKSRKIMRR